MGVKMRFLLDTNVVSELRRSAASHAVRVWIEALGDEQMYVSVLTLGEIRRGISALAGRDPQQAASLTTWLTHMRTGYGARVLPITAAIAERWGTFNAIRTFPAIDALLAATAYEYGLTVATRNVRDFAGLPVEVFNPFATEARSDSMG